MLRFTMMVWILLNRSKDPELPVRRILSRGAATWPYRATPSGLIPTRGVSSSQSADRHRIAPLATVILGHRACRGSAAGVRRASQSSCGERPLILRRIAGVARTGDGPYGMLSDMTSQALSLQ